MQKGYFENATEVICAGLLLLEDNEARVEYLRELIDQADKSIAAGKGKSYDNATLLAEIIIKRGQAKSTRTIGK